MSKIIFQHFLFKIFFQNFFFSRFFFTKNAFYFYNYITPPLLSFKFYFKIFFSTFFLHIFFPKLYFKILFNFFSKFLSKIFFSNFFPIFFSFSKLFFTKTAFFFYNYITPPFLMWLVVNWLKIVNFALGIARIRTWPFQLKSEEKYRMLHGSEIDFTSCNFTLAETRLLSSLVP